MQRYAFQWILAVVLVIIVLAACTTGAPNPAGVQAVTAVPTLDTTNVDALCEAVDTHWGRDWETTIRALEALDTLDTLCADGLAIDNRLYTAYLAYGTLLEGHGRQDEALAAYTSALERVPTGVEAADRLQHLNVYTPQPPQRCEPGVVAEALRTLPGYTPTAGSFVRIHEGRFVLEGQAYPIYGVNYYPRNTPFRRFLTETEIEVVSAELDIVQRAGLNTLRVFLRYETLFTCPGNGAVPVAENFLRLDGIIREAAEQGFKLIVTLNDSPDLSVHPLYDSPTHTVEQTRFVVERYREEPAILAWDLRGGGDTDYTDGDFEREAVLEWLVETSNTVHQSDPNHLITAGWRDEAEATIPAVDFVSFQYYADIEPFRQRVAIIRSQTDKPILLIAVGYSTHTMDETAQRNLLYQILEGAQVNELAGWLVLTAFDYPLSATCVEPDCPGEDMALNHFGLWNTSYFPKSALDAVKVFTGAE